MTETYIAYDNHSAIIYGVGDTPDEACARADKDWGIPGDWLTAPASAALVAQIESRGGRIPWTIVDGIACCADPEVEAQPEPAADTREFRAYDKVTEWSGPVRQTEAAAAADASRHNRSLAAQGGYGSAIVAVNDDGRLRDLDGRWIWPPHGRGCGAAEWVKP